jgi:hypothetical protein
MEFPPFACKTRFLELQGKRGDVNQGHPKIDLDALAMNRYRSRFHLRQSAFICSSVFSVNSVSLW